MSSEPGARETGRAGHDGLAATQAKARVGLDPKVHRAPRRAGPGFPWAVAREATGQGLGTPPGLDSSLRAQGPRGASGLPEIIHLAEDLLVLDVAAVLLPQRRAAHGALEAAHVPDEVVDLGGGRRWGAAQRGVGGGRSGGLGQGKCGLPSHSQTPTPPLRSCEGLSQFPSGAGTRFLGEVGRNPWPIFTPQTGNGGWGSGEVWGPLGGARREAAGSRGDMTCCAHHPDAPMRPQARPDQAGAPRASDAP